MATEEETRAAAYRAQAVTRAAAMNARYVGRFGSRAAYLALYDRTKAISGVQPFDIEVYEQSEETEDEDEQTP